MASRLQRSLSGTDVHCHILPGMDDGSPSLEITQELLLREREQGVRQIIFTPHFYADRMNVSDFLRRRKRAERTIIELCEELELSYRVGAEVRMTPELLQLDLSPLAIEKTKYLLLEWPFNGYPIWGPEVVDRVYDIGSLPIFAHIERVPFFFQHPKHLTTYIENGVLCQVNATALLQEKTQHQTLRLIREGYVHLIGTDAHNLDRRPPYLGDAYAMVEKRLGKDCLEQLKRNAASVFQGNILRTSAPKERKKRSPFS